MLVQRTIVRLLCLLLLYCNTPLMAATSSEQRRAEAEKIRAEAEWAQFQQTVEQLAAAGSFNGSGQGRPSTPPDGADAPQRPIAVAPRPQHVVPRTPAEGRAQGSEPSKRRSDVGRSPASTPPSSAAPPASYREPLAPQPITRRDHPPRPTLPARDAPRKQGQVAAGDRWSPDAVANEGGGGAGGVSLQFGDVVTGSLADDTEIDRYFLTVAAATTAAFDRISTTNSNGINWQIRDAYGRVLLSKLTSFSDGGPVDLLPGSYTIEVFAESNQSGDYEFRVVEVVPDVSSVALGDTLDGEIEFPGAVDRYDFTAPAGLLVIDRLAASNVNGLNYTLLDGFGRAIIARTTILNDSARIALLGGSYTLIVEGELSSNQLQTGTYSLALTAVTDEQSTINIGDVITGSIDVGQRDVFNFTAPADSLVTLDRIATSNSNGLNWQIEDANGRPVLARTGSLEDSGPLRLIGGDYTLTLLGENGSGWQTGTYEFQLVVPSSTSGSFAIGDTVSGALNVPGESASYTFSATPGQLVTLDLLASSNNNGLNWRIRDAAGRSVLNRTNLLNDVGPIALVGGSYTLEVLGESSLGSVQTGTFEFRLVPVVQNTTATTIGSTISGGIDDVGEIERYTFNAPVGQLVTFDVTAASNSNVLNWRLEDDRGLLLFGTTNNLADQGPFTLRGGDYVLTILGENLGTAQVGTYSVDLIDGGIDAGFVPSGTALVLDTPLNDQIDVAGSPESFLISLAAPQRLLFDALSGANTLRWSLFDPVGRPIFNNQRLQFASSDDRGPFELAAGNYELRIEDTAGGTPTYGFTVWQAQDRSFTVSPDSPAGDNLVTAGTIHTYDLTLAADTTLFFDVQTSTSSARWSLFDSAGRSVFGEPTVVSDTGPWPLVAGSYELRIRASGNSGPSYGFELISVTETSATVNVGDVITGPISSAAGVDRYDFAVAAGQKLFFDVRSGSSSLRWTLSDPLGQPVFFNRTPSGSTTDQGPYLLTAGTYRLTLNSININAPNYDIQIADVVDLAASAPLNAPIVGTLATPGAEHVYTLSVPNDGDALFFDNDLASGDVYATLRDSEGQAIFISNRLLSATSSDIGPFALTMGDYSLSLVTNNGNTANYQLTPWLAAQLEDPLQFDVSTAGDIPQPGATHAYTFSSQEGQKFLFDLESGGTDLVWSLVDPSGSAAGLINQADAEDPQDDDVGPLNLQAGNYRLVLDGAGAATPAYVFQLLNLANDLSVSAFTVTPDAVFEDETDRQLAVSWTVRNSGGLQTSASWTDRIVLSDDFELGDADDIELGSFAITEAIDPGQTYSRNANLSIPDTLLLGDYRLFLVVDAFDDLFENLGEGDNLTSRPFSVLPAGQFADPAFRTVESFIEIDLDQFGGVDDGFVYDVPLEEAVDLTDVRFVGMDAVRWTYDGNGVVTLDAILLDRDIEVVEIEDWGFSGTITGVTQVDRAGVQLTAAQIATLPSRNVDGLRFKFSWTNGSGQSQLESTFPDGKIRVYFATCEFAECGPHRAESFLGLEGFDTGGNNTTEFKEIDLVESIPALGLRYVSVGPFLYSWFIGGTPTATIEVQLRLNDGSTVVLDDWASPSEQAAPDTTFTLTPFAALGITPELSADLADKWIVGWRWRVHSAGGSFDVVPGCPASSNFCSVDTPVDLLFAYEFGACKGQPAVGPVDLAPADGSQFPAGSSVTLTGQVTSPDPTVPVASILIDGEPPDSIDALGRFFKQVTVEQGLNSYAIDTLQPTCGESMASLTLEGVMQAESVFDNAADVSTRIDAQYRNPSFNPAAGLFLVEARGCNDGPTPIAGPLQLVVRNIQGEGVLLARPDGFSPAGDAFVTARDNGGDGTLDPGECTDYARLVFTSPQGSPARFDAQWFGPLNDAPFFVSIPSTVTTVGNAYQYDAVAIDPDDGVLTYRLIQSPAGMTIDAAGGQIDWVPGAADAGTHSVTVAVSDGAGGEATQDFALSVNDGTINQAPYFTSSPLTRAPTGAAYSYPALAFDPEGDALTFVLLDGPAGSNLDGVSGLFEWGFTLPGSYSIDIEVGDGRGGFARQQFTLTVGSPATNPTLPRLFGSPAGVGVIDQLYLYQPIVDNPDDGEAVNFSLDTAPAGMNVDPLSGRVDWTPVAGQEGPNSVTLRADDGNGGAATQSWTIEVSSTPINREPVIDTVPGLKAIVDQPYVYYVHATDPDGDALTYGLIAPPVGMTIDPMTGRIDWLPNVIGSETIAVQATDPSGAFGAQVFDLDVVPPNVEPTIQSTPPAISVTVGTPFQYEVLVDDPDGQPLTFDLPVAPPGMEIHAQLGLISWVPSAAQAGDNPVTVRVRDDAGGSATQSFVVTVDPDLVPPTIRLRLSNSPAPTGQEFQVCVDAGDDIAVTAQRLFADGVAVALDNINCAILRYDQSTQVLLRGEAEDIGLNLSFEELLLDIVDPDDGNRPTVDVDSLLPPPGSVISAPTDIVASILESPDGAGLPINSWEVRIAPLGSDDFRVIASGSGPTDNAVIATLDPTILANGIYRFQIEADNGLLTGGVEYEYSVAGELKLGRYQTLLNDGVLGAGGIPISINRVYDSTDRMSGDFGNNWNLMLPGRVDDGPNEFYGSGLVETLSTEAFTRSTRIYVARPDGRRVGFTFNPTPNGMFPFINTPRFEADPGINDTLEAISPTGTPSVWEIGGRFFEFVIPYNPRTYVLTTEDGTRYTIDELEGLQQVETTAAVTLTVDATGIRDSMGNGLVFTRDAQDRITNIRPAELGDPTPSPGITYDYDGLGNLIRVTDAAGTEQTYVYDDPLDPQALTRIEGDGGEALRRIVYNAEGRVVAECPLDGNITTFDGCYSYNYDVANRLITNFDNRGSRTDFFLDVEGNALSERRFTDLTNFLEWTYTYDADSNLLTQTDPAGDTWRIEYDAFGQEVRRTEPGGQVWTSAYDDCGLVEQCNPNGDCWTVTYDPESCDTTTLTSPLGDSTQFQADLQTFSEIDIEPNGVTWTRQYSPTDRYLDQRTDPAGGTTVVDVTGEGLVNSIADPAGRTVTFTIDDENRPVTETWDSVPQRVISFAYSAAGQLQTLDDQVLSMQYDYYPTGKLRNLATNSIASGPIADVTYEYDPNGYISAVVDSFGGRTEYEYDTLNRITKMSQSGAGVTDKRVEVAYDELARTVSYRYFTGLSSTNPDAESDYVYTCWDQCDHRLAAIEHRDGSGALIERFDLVRDGAGNVIQLTDADGVHSFSYDGLSRLIAADRPGVLTDESYTYDAVGNRLTSHLSNSHLLAYSQADCGSGPCGYELLEDDAFTYSYDAVGNLTAKANKTTGETTSFAYDHRNRIERVEARDSGGALLDATAYTYDPINRRVQIDQGGTTTFKLFAEYNPIVETDGAGVVKLRRLYAPRIDDLYAEEEAGSIRWMLRDHTNSVRHVWEGGVSAQRRVYDAFGNEPAGSGPVGCSTIGYMSREFDGTAGLGYFRARYYDPTTGRFHNRDPLYPYRYDFVDNNPFLMSDPTGRSTAIEYACTAVLAASNALKLVKTIGTSVGSLIVGIVALASAGGVGPGVVGLIEAFQGWGEALLGAAATAAGALGALDLYCNRRKKRIEDQQKRLQERLKRLIGGPPGPR